MNRVSKMNCVFTVISTRIEDFVQDQLAVTDTARNTIVTNCFGSFKSTQ